MKENSYNFIYNFISLFIYISKTMYTYYIVEWLIVKRLFRIERKKKNAQTERDNINKINENNGFVTKETAVVIDLQLVLMSL